MYEHITSLNSTLSKQDICKPGWRHREGGVWKQGEAVKAQIKNKVYSSNLYLLL